MKYYFKQMEDLIDEKDGVVVKVQPDETKVKLINDGKESCTFEWKISVEYEVRKPSEFVRLLLLLLYKYLIFVLVHGP